MSLITDYLNKAKKEFTSGGITLNLNKGKPVSQKSLFIDE